MLGLLLPFATRNKYEHVFRVISQNFKTYLKGKKVKRLDKTINAVLKLTRDSFFQRLIKLSKNAPTEKIKKVRRSHEASKTIKFEQI